MAKKRNCDAVPRPPKKKKVHQVQCIKMSLRKGLKCDDQHVKAKITTAIEHRVLTMTKCFILAALNIHCFLSDLIAMENDDKVTAYFTQVIDKNFFKDFFRGTTWIGQDDSTIRNSGFNLHLPINHMCRRYGITAPDLTGFGNIVQYMFQMYFTNFKNNIWMHGYSRMNRFCKAHQHQAKLVKDTMHYLFKKNSNKMPDPHIIAQIQTCLRPIKFGDGRGYFVDIEASWWKFVPLFMRLQA